jgi:hypothetical protein
MIQSNVSKKLFQVSPKQAYKGTFEFRPKKARMTESEAIENENATRFFFSRHPFDRLVSAYVQKIELSSKDDVTFKGNERRCI